MYSYQQNFLILFFYWIQSVSKQAEIDKLRSYYILVILIFAPIVLYSQDIEFDYFSDKKYPDHPLITLRENFLGNPVYLIDGGKIKASEVRAYMEIMPGDAQDFSNTHAKAVTGTGVFIGGQMVVLGAFGYLYHNRDRLNNQIVQNWFLYNFGGGVVGIAGRFVNRQQVRKINTLVENHNFLIRHDQMSGPYLKMNFEQNIMGERIVIYDGPNLLSKKDIIRYQEEYPEFSEYYRKAQRNQNLSFALDIVSLASTLAFIGYIASPQFQSSAPSNFIVPLTIVNTGVNISSGLVRRAARNQTRVALMKFNFRDEYSNPR